MGQTKMEKKEAGGVPESDPANDSWRSSKGVMAGMCLALEARLWGGVWGCTRGRRGWLLSCCRHGFGFLHENNAEDRIADE
jgi:hypothetical protein